MIWLILSAVLVAVSSGSLTNIDVVPKGCKWLMQPLEGSEGDVETVLHCQISTINSVGSLTGNLTQTQADRVTVLMLGCSDVLSFESLECGRQGSFLSLLKRLKELKVENCKIRNIPSVTFAPLRQLRLLSMRSHNSEWPTMTLELDPESFRGMEELRSLDLADNNIWSMPADLLYPLCSLRNLNLSYNKLVNVSELGFSEKENGSLEVDCSYVNSLQALDISNNDITWLPDKGFSALLFLEELRLENNAISTLDDGALVGLSALTKLNMSSNSLVALPSKLFQSSRDIRQIYLHNNYLGVLAPGLLEGLDQLRVLDLSHNELTSLWNNRNTFAGLVKLEILNLTNNQLTSIDATLFHDLCTLQKLNLEHNSISIITEGAFAELKQLHALNLTGNKIAHVESHTFSGMYALKQLFLDSNFIGYIDPEAFENITNLIDLGLSGNKLAEVPMGIRRLRFLKILDLGQNRIKSVTNSSFKGLDLLYGLRLKDNDIVNISMGAFSTLPSLQVLNLASNKIKYLEQSAFSSNPILQAIRLDANQLSDISGVFNKLQELVWLNIASNKLLGFDFSHLPNLEWLDMHDNNITELGNYDGVSLKIKTLDVGYNSIRELKKNSVPDNISTLILRNNKIVNVDPYTFYNKTHLEIVALQYNEIRYLDVTSLKLSPVANDKNLPQFYFAGNPFHCNCEMEYLLRINLLSNSREYPRVPDLEAVTCELAHSRGSPLRPLLSLKPSNFLCPYTTHCFPLCYCCDFIDCDCEMICPDRCTCYRDYTWSSNVVDCTNAEYTNVPKKLPVDATEIYLDGNNLGELVNFAFIGMRQLRVLFLNNSNIVELHNRTFYGIRSLQTLHLENNKLKELRGFEFDNLKDLKELYLDQNEIGYLSNRTFINMPKLKVLKLDENKVVEVDANIPESTTVS